MPDSVFFDTNVLVYAHDEQDARKRELARTLILEALRSGNGWISTQVLSEFYVTVTRKVRQKMSEDAARRAVVLLSRLKVIDLDATLVLRAIELAQTWKVNYWDALIVASAERAKCSALLSEDLSDGLRLAGLTIRNPFR